MENVSSPNPIVILFTNLCLSLIAKKIHISQTTMAILRSFGTFIMSKRGLVEMKVRPNILFVNTSFHIFWATALMSYFP